MNKTTEALKLADEHFSKLFNKVMMQENLGHQWTGLTLADGCYEALAAIREVLADLIPDATKMVAEPVKQEPVYAFRRRGLDDFCTCTKERYEELVDRPNLFEVTTFYASPVSVEAEWIETNKALAKEIIEQRNQYLDKLAEAIDLSVKAEREACAKVCEKAMIQMNYSEAPYKQCAAAIRGMK